MRLTDIFTNADFKVFREQHFDNEELDIKADGHAAARFGFENYPDFMDFFVSNMPDEPMLGGAMASGAAMLFYILDIILQKRFQKYTPTKPN